MHQFWKQKYIKYDVSDAREGGDVENCELCRFFLRIFFFLLFYCFAIESVRRPYSALNWMYNIFLCPF